MARLSESQKQTVREMYEAAAAAGLSGPQADLAVIQAIHETGWGRSPSGRNNYHGIKDFSGQGTKRTTWEVENGRRVTRREPFANFDSKVGSFAGWKGLMERVYPGVMDANTLDEAVLGLNIGVRGKPSYATDPRYNEKVRAIGGLIADYRPEIAPKGLLDFARRTELNADVEGLFGLGAPPAPATLDGFNIVATNNMTGLPTPQAKPAQVIGIPQAKPGAGFLDATAPISAPRSATGPSGNPREAYGSAPAVSRSVDMTAPSQGLDHIDSFDMVDMPGTTAELLDAIGANDAPRAAPAPRSNPARAASPASGIPSAPARSAPSAPAAPSAPGGFGTPSGGMTMAEYAMSGIPQNASFDTPAVNAPGFSPGAFGGAPLDLMGTTPAAPGVPATPAATPARVGPAPSAPQAKKGVSFGNIAAGAVFGAALTGNPMGAVAGALAGHRYGDKVRGALPSLPSFSAPFSGVANALSSGGNEPAIQGGLDSYGSGGGFWSGYAASGGGSDSRSMARAGSAEQQARAAAGQSTWGDAFRNDFGALFGGGGSEGAASARNR